MNHTTREQAREQALAQLRDHRSLPASAELREYTGPIIAGNPPIIALAGRAGAGKSYAAHLLTKHGFEERKFATTLKRMCEPLLEALDIEATEWHRWLEGPLKEAPLPRIYVTPRRIMQTLGTEWRNLVHPQLWLLLQPPHTQPTVYSDLRFEAEAQWIKQQGGSVWYIHSETTRVSGAEQTHASEQFDPLLADAHIYNDYTPNFEQLVYQFLKKIY